MSGFLENLKEEINKSYQIIMTSFKEYIDKDKERGNHSFHPFVYAEALENENRDLLNSMNFFTYIPFNIDFLYYIHKEVEKNIIVHCGSAHAHFLEYFLRRTGYLLHSAYGEKDEIETHKDTDYEESLLAADLPSEIDKKFIDFMSC